MARALNAKQRAFVAAYVETGNAAEAVRRAGYTTKQPDSYGSALLRKRHVESAVTALRLKVEARLGISKAEVLEVLASIARSDKDETRDRISACRELSKMLGYNAPEKHEVTVVDYKSRLEAMLGPGDDGDLGGDAPEPDA